MAQYIDKDSVLTEIERRIKTNKECMLGLRNLDYYQGKVDALNDTNSFIDTLEIKEVDLEKEVESFAYTLPHSTIGDGEHLGKFDDPKVKEARKHGWSHLWRYNYVKEIAKHFFDLGLRASNPLTWEDIAHINSITSVVLAECKDNILYDTEEEFSKEVLKRFKEQKGE